MNQAFEKLAMERGLPSALDSERMVLASFMIQGRLAIERFGSTITADCFATEANRKIWKRMCAIYERGGNIDRITVCEELRRFNELADVGGLAYLVEMEDGMPILSNIESYVASIREKAALRRVIAIAQNTLSRALLAEEDASQIVSSAKNALEGVETQRESAQWMDFDATVASEGGTFEDFISPGRRTINAGIRTPWDAINKCVCSIPSGDLFLVAARPSMGKSIVGLQLARKAAEDGYGVAYFSLEMKTASLERRLLVMLSGVDAYRMKLGYLNDAERDAIRAARDIRRSLPISMISKGCRTAPAISAALRELMATQKIGLVVIDHFHLVRGVSAHEEERIRFSRIADEFQTTAREMEIPFVVLCQLSRKCEEENRAPGLSDLKETGKLEENADGIMFVHRPEVYAKNRGKAELAGVAQFILAKQRDGMTGTFDMQFFGGLQRFEVAERNA